LNSLKHTSASRWVLGFDGSCHTCARMAEQARSIAGDTIEILSLRTTEVQAWSISALGPDAPWTPTLYEVSEGDVRAWTGSAMAARLTRLLGPRRAIKLARMIGAEAVEVDNVVNPGRRALTKALVGTGAAGLLLDMQKQNLIAAAAGESFEAVQKETYLTAVNAAERAMLAAQFKSDAYGAFSSYMMAHGYELSQSVEFVTAVVEGKKVRSAESKLGASLRHQKRPPLFLFLLRSPLAT